MSTGYVFKCACGRTVRVYSEKGKVKHETKGTGDALLDALTGEEPEGDDPPKDGGDDGR